MAGVAVSPPSRRANRPRRSRPTGRRPIGAPVIRRRRPRRPDYPARTRGEETARAASAITPAQQIRDLLAAGGTVNMPGVYDALTARLAAETGFEVLFVSGYSVAASRLGMPDLGYIGVADMADAARGICAAVPAPVIVDADTGYGNALSARRTARVLHAAGAAGIFLEDQEWPKRCGHFAGKRVVPRAEWLAKLRAVLDLREEGVDLFLVARTDARAAARWTRRSSARAPLATSGWTRSSSRHRDPRTSCARWPSGSAARSASPT